VFNLQPSYVRQTLRGARKEGEFVHVSFLSHLSSGLGKKVFFGGLAAYGLSMLLWIFGAAMWGLVIGGITTVAVLGVIIGLMPVDGQSEPGWAGYSLYEKWFPSGMKEETFTEEVKRL
jgi:hypothetical protein